MLAVDDDPDILRLLQLTLGLEGHEVLTAADGRCALGLVRRVRPDIVLLDVMMANLDGIQVCKAIRADEDPEVVRLPIVMLSGKTEGVDVAAGMAAGADAYLTKPFELTVLIELVARLVRESVADDNSS